MIPPSISAEARSDLETAKTLTWVAMILQVIIAVIGLLIPMFLLAVSFLSSLPAPAMASGPAVQAQIPISMELLLLPVLGGFGILPLIFFVLTYFLVYKRVSEGSVEASLTPALVLGILSLFFGGVIPGILLIIAYVKAKDAHIKILHGGTSAAPPS